MNGELREMKIIGRSKADGVDKVLSIDSLSFISGLDLEFQPRIEKLLKARALKQEEYDAGALPSFSSETESIRASNWKISSLNDDLVQRKVEITGPVDRKMVINALNSGADVYMADFEDSSSPTWENMLRGQINLYDANAGDISFYNKSKKKKYSLNNKTATLMVRPRGFLLYEKNILINEKPISAALFDFGIYFYNNAKKLIEKGSAPYFYLPKLESYLEARLWNDIFLYSQRKLRIPSGTIKATVLIETLPAAFQMDEILYELNRHSAGLNFGRWDYIFSFIKKLRNNKDIIFPDRSQITMDRTFLEACSNMLVDACHRRGAHAIGGMAAQIPIKNDPEANATALDKVRQDKIREAQGGYDGTWVAHPNLVSLAREIFDAEIDGSNQIDKRVQVAASTEEALVRIPCGVITEEGFRQNVRVGLQYVESWLRGVGCVPLYNLMEDAATAEICRAQIWHWIKHRARFEDGNLISKKKLSSVIKEEVNSLGGRATVKKFDEAKNIFYDICTSKKFHEFLTTSAYEALP